MDFTKYSDKEIRRGFFTILGVLDAYVILGKLSQENYNYIMAMAENSIERKRKELEAAAPVL